MMLGTNKESKTVAALIPPGSTGIELGVWRGDSSVLFLKRAAFLHLVDAWSVIAYEASDEFGSYQAYLDRYSKLTGGNTPKDFQKYYDGVYESVKQKLHGKPVKIHRCTTDAFFEKFDEQVDWLYVDASHAYAGCSKDLNNSLKVLKPGGCIFGDDYGNKPEVKRAVDDFVKEKALKLTTIGKYQYKITR